MTKRLFPKMKVGPKRIWLAALRSRKYRRAKGQLGNDKLGFCCLGVLCHAAGVTYASEKSLLTDGQCEKFGVDDDVQCTLADFNDGEVTKYNHEGVPKPRGYRKNKGASFPAIADWIEKYL